MQSHDELSVSEIAGSVGEKPRTVQFWADVGVLRASEASNRRGKGVHRKFHRRELGFARVAHLLASTNSPIGEIEKVISCLRSIDVLKVIDGMRERLESVKDKINSDDGLKKFEYWSELVDYIGMFGLAGAFEEAVYVIVSHFHHEGEGGVKIRFWADDIRGFMHIDTYAAVAIHGFIGFKAVKFASLGELNLGGEYSNYNDPSYVRTGMKELMHKHQQMLAASMFYAATNNFEESYGSVFGERDVTG